MLAAAAWFAACCASAVVGLAAATVVAGAAVVSDERLSHEATTTGTAITIRRARRNRTDPKNDRGTFTTSPFVLAMRRDDHGVTGAKTAS
jgi:hypothetical protein